MDSASAQLIDDICSSDPARVAAAIQAAATRQETLAPVLLARLEEAAGQPTLWTKAKDGRSPVFLFYLAAAWREKRAHPFLAAILRLPPKQCDDLLGDFITEGARLVLADTWAGDLSVIEGISFDSSADPFARGTALNAAALLAARGLIAREEVLALFSRVAASPLDPDIENDSTTATGLVSAIMDLGAWELRGTVITLFERDLVDFGWVGDEEEVLEKLEPGTKFTLDSYRFPAPITNAWESVKGWHFFAPLRTGRERVRPHEPELIVGDAPAEPAIDLDEQDFINTAPQLPYHAPAKPGRNDPCTCGSGKKYKKCCGA
jgi:hypothetical protein